MYKSRTTFLTLLIATSAFALACPSPRGPGGGGGGGDDDDVAGDDDDAADDDDFAADDDDFTADDDDAVADDDDAVGFDADGLTFQFALTAVEGVNGTVTITGEYIVSYWVDIMNGIRNCDQHMNFEAQYVHGFGVDTTPGCTNCSGHVTFNLGAFQDVSNPNLDPDHCLPADLDAVGANYAVRMTQPADPNATPANYGDFGDDLGIIDQETHDILGTDWTTADASTSDRTRAGSEAEWAQYSLDYTHTGFVNATPQSLAGSAGLNAITRPENPGSLFLAAWEMFINPANNTNTAAALEGEYGGSANFILTLGTGG